MTEPALLRAIRRKPAEAKMLALCVLGMALIWAAVVLMRL